jgi:hypothetical protein
MLGLGNEGIRFGGGLMMEVVVEAAGTTFGEKRRGGGVLSGKGRRGKKPRL